MFCSVVLDQLEAISWSSSSRLVNVFPHFPLHTSIPKLSNSSEVKHLDVLVYHQKEKVWLSDLKQ